MPKLPPTQLDLPLFTTVPRPGEEGLPLGDTPAARRPRSPAARLFFSLAELLERQSRHDSSRTRAA